MLALLLAFVVALGSFLLYFAAFFFPEVHRKSDFYWSGLGLFYGLVLWVCAGRITGGVLLGQLASVALLLWFGTQTLILRRVLASPSEKTNISQSVATHLQSLSPLKLWQKISKQDTQTLPRVTSSTQETASIASEQSSSQEIDQQEEATTSNEETPKPEDSKTD